VHVTGVTVDDLAREGLTIITQLADDGTSPEGLPTRPSSVNRGTANGRDPRGSCTVRTRLQRVLDPTGDRRILAKNRTSPQRRGCRVATRCSTIARASTGSNNPYVVTRLSVSVEFVCCWVRSNPLHHRRRAVHPPLGHGMHSRSGIARSCTGQLDPSHDLLVTMNAQHRAGAR
jgi:hypothetical protein